jgi:ubiquinone/menaquinone biosynthesis C-methylase UbiE
MQRSEPSANQDQAASLDNTFFERQWQIYQKVLENDYMGHRAIYSILQQFWVKHFSRPFSLLELGCGDASFTCRSLSGVPLARYHGIDRSEEALQMARTNTAELPCPACFSQGDLLDLIRELAEVKREGFDAILMSFVLHHFSRDQKDEIIGRLHTLLNRNGVVLLIDVMRPRDEDRDVYIGRYLADVRQRWSRLTQEEYTLVEDHISENDFPETQETLCDFAKKRGFNPGARLYQDALNTTQFLVFHRSVR